jgi:alkylation response protein AidB-like acyl-CoA dehydrogenase
VALSSRTGTGLDVTKQPNPKAAPLKGEIMDFALTADQAELADRAATLAREVITPRAAEVDRTEAYPWDNVAALTDSGFMGMTIPVAYGGQGRSFLDAVLVIERMAQVCGVTARIVVEANMGAISAVMLYGTEAQKKFASRFVLGGDKPAICITEPDAGSAANEMTTRADRRGDRFIINGRKHWITGGGVSKLHLIFARVFDERGNEEGIGGFLAVRDETKGLVIGAREPAMGLRGIPETEVIFDNMTVPADMALMPPGGFRRGFAGLMDAYNSQRVGAATVALGLAEGAYRLALDYAGKREQFGRPIAEFQGLQWMLADMSTQLDAARLLIHRAAVDGRQGEDFRVGDGDQGQQRRTSDIRCARLFEKPAARAHRARFPHVHDRRWHGADSANRRRVAHSRAQAAADPRWIPQARRAQAQRRSRVGVYPICLRGSSGKSAASAASAPYGVRTSWTVPAAACSTAVMPIAMLQSSRGE